MSLAALLAGGGLGAALALLLDPAAGRRRRALLRDRAVHLYKESGGAVEAAARDAINRARGLVAETRGLLQPDDAPDDVVRERVRSSLGLHVSHPRAVEVAVADGHVTLTGPIVAHELEPLVAAVSRVRGVKALENRLTAHAEAAGVPGLQGGRERRPSSQRSWPPALRALAGTAGAALLARAAGMRRLGGFTLGTVGVGLLARAMSNAAPPGDAADPDDGAERRDGGRAESVDDVEAQLAAAPAPPLPPLGRS